MILQLVERIVLKFSCWFSRCTYNPNWKWPGNSFKSIAFFPWVPHTLPSDSVASVLFISEQFIPQIKTKPLKFPRIAPTSVSNRPPSIETASMVVRSSPLSFAPSHYLPAWRSARLGSGADGARILVLRPRASSNPNVDGAAVRLASTTSSPASSAVDFLTLCQRLKVTPLISRSLILDCSSCVRIN